MSTILDELIDRIGHGNQATAARALQVTPQRLNDYKRERLGCPVRTLVRAAELAGMDPVYVIGRYHFDRWRKTGGSLAQAATATVAIALAALPGPAPHAASPNVRFDSLSILRRVTGAATSLPTLHRRRAVRTEAPAG